MALIAIGALIFLALFIYTVRKERAKGVRRYVTTYFLGILLFCFVGGATGLLSAIGTSSLISKIAPEMREKAVLIDNLEIHTFQIGSNNNYRVCYYNKYKYNGEEEVICKNIGYYDTFFSKWKGRTYKRSVSFL